MLLYGDVKGHIAVLERFEPVHLDHIVHGQISAMTPLTSENYNTDDTRFVVITSDGTLIVC